MAKYSEQMGAILASACRDFGVRLIKSWDATTTLDAPSPTREEIEEFVAEAIKNFFGTGTAGTGTEAAGLKASSPEKKKPLKAVVKKKKKSEAPEAPEAPEEEKKPLKASKKPKCQATTAKGTRCTKCAVGDGPFCSVHVKKAESEGGGESSKPVGKGGKGISRGTSSKKKSKKEPVPVHTHGLDGDAEDAEGEKKEPCEVCERHGAPFEIPEYELDLDGEASEPDAADDDDDVAKDPDFDVEEEERRSGGGGGFSTMGEEDFDEDEE